MRKKESERFLCEYFACRENNKQLTHVALLLPYLDTNTFLGNDSTGLYKSSGSCQKMSHDKISTFSSQSISFPDFQIVYTMNFENIKRYFQSPFFYWSSIFSLETLSIFGGQKLISYHYTGRPNCVPASYVCYMCAKRKKGHKRNWTQQLTQLLLLPQLCL